MRAQQIENYHNYTKPSSELHIDMAIQLSIKSLIQPHESMPPPVPPRIDELSKIRRMRKISCLCIPTVIRLIQVKSRKCSTL